MRRRLEPEPHANRDRSPDEMADMTVPESEYDFTEAADRVDVAVPAVDEPDPESLRVEPFDG